MWGTAPGLIALLTENKPEYQIHGLKMLDQFVETEWPQIADSLDIITKLANDNTFPAHEQAALLASKTYYHLLQLDDAVNYALKAGGSFIPIATDEYTTTVVAYAFKTYIKVINTPENQPTDTNYLPALNQIITCILDNLISNNKCTECLSLAIEARFIQYVQRSLELQPDLVPKAITLTTKIITDSKYRFELLQLFVKFATDNCDKFQLSELHHALNDPRSVGYLLKTLFESEDTDNHLLAYQIAFELAENASQKFRSTVIETIGQNCSPQLKDILTRKKLLDLYLNFLFKNSKTDLHVIVNLKDTLDTNHNLIHCAVIITYAFMFTGTGDDNFYRNNTQWFPNSNQWAQFLTIASLASIHIGHLKSALTILQNFLVPKHPYAYAGGLYGLGLIYANYIWEPDIIRIVMDTLANSTNDVVKHGSCLSLGLITMGSQDLTFYNPVLGVIRDDRPEPGEAAGYAMGLIMLGNGETPVIDEFGESKVLTRELYDIANTTEHDKITRGAAMGLAFMYYGLEDRCESMVKVLLASRKPLIRESAAWVTALAYVGTASNAALQRLLHIAVSDVNPDVRRAAVIGVGFVLSRSPKEVPGMVDLLAKSYHPHVRSGAALALGIACAGTGMAEAIAILKPLLSDLEDFVKQSAMIAMAMVLQQQSDAAVPYAKEFRTYLRKLITKKRSEMQVFGICLAYGILIAGGRNVVISCNSLRGENSVLSTVGIALFCNYFYWTPLALMLTLSFHPTAIIGLDKNLEVPDPDWKIFSKAPKKMFAIPPSFESEKEVFTLGKAVALSVSKPEDKKEEEEKKEVEVEEEDDFEILPNQSRVTLNQLPLIDFSFDTNYTPITGKIFHGFVMLKENKKDDEDEK